MGGNRNLRYFLSELVARTRVSDSFQFFVLLKNEIARFHFAVYEGFSVTRDFIGVRNHQSGGFIYSQTDNCVFSSQSVAYYSAVGHT